MIDVVRKVLALLSPKERKEAYLLLVMILVMAFLDVVGIASIMPFMAVVANPDVIQSNEWLNMIYTWLEFSDPKRFLFFLGIAVFLFLVVSVSFKAITNWAITHFTQMRNYSISRRLVSGYLRQPYEWFLSRHSADLGKTVLSEVQLVVQGALMPLMHLIAHGTLVAAILILLMAVDPGLALIVGIAMGGAYAMIFLVFRRLLDRIGRDRVAANAMRFKTLSDTFGGIKEVKLAGIEQGALAGFDIPAKRFARTQVLAQVVGLMPKFLLEIVAFGGVLLLVLLLMRRAGSFEGAIPIISLYALAGYRLMPALQTAYSHATKIRFSSDAVDMLFREYAKLDSSPIPGSTSGAKVIPKEAIRLERVSYSYPNAERSALEDLSLQIAANSTIGIVGTTGSGKTTTVDVILGLLTPQQGALSVDGLKIDETNVRAWQRTLGYVPQQIFLADDTVEANIAFGVPEEDVDSAAVERAARIANLHQFVVAELPQGYRTLVGERGVRLSGGQRQRIGIARAMYQKPRVLVLDEATSALDNATEQAVMDAVKNLEGEVTIVLVAHRLTTVRSCDLIFLLENGALLDEGDYEHLCRNNLNFQSMANIRRQTEAN